MPLDVLVSGAGVAGLTTAPLVSGRVELHFGDRVVALAARGERMHAELAGGEALEVDLVVGADGVHSGVRRLAWGEAHPAVRHLGLAGVGFSTAAHWVPARTGALWQAPGLAAYVVDAGEPHRRTVSLSFASHDTGFDRGTRAEQEVATRQAFDGHGWRVPELLAAMAAAQDLHGSSALQVVLDQWSRGPVVLVGDAAGCAAPTSGQGTSQALLGARSLVRHLTSGRPIPQALAAYEAELRPLVEANQRLGREGAARFGALNP